MHKRLKKIVYILIVLFVLSACSNRKVLNYRNYGLDYYENENYEEALNCFNQAIELGNGEIGRVQYDLLMYKAECLFMLGRYDEAKIVYSNLLKIDKNNEQYKELYKNVASIVLLVEFKKSIDNDDIEKAEEVLNELKENGLEHEKSVMYNQAVLYEKKGEWKDALNSFNYYLKQYPGDENALHEVEFISAQLQNVN